MSLPGPMRDRELEMAQWTMCLTLEESYQAIMGEVGRMIEDICAVAWWRPFKKRRLVREMNLAWRLMEAFQQHATEQDALHEALDSLPPGFCA